MAQKKMLEVQEEKRLVYEELGKTKTQLQDECIEFDRHLAETDKKVRHFRFYARKTYDRKATILYAIRFFVNVMIVFSVSQHGS